MLNYSVQSYHEVASFKPEVLLYVRYKRGHCALDGARLNCHALQ